MTIRYQGFRLQRLWPRTKRDPAGWMLRLGGETMLLSRREQGWQIKPCDQPLCYQRNGWVQDGALDPDFHQLCMLIQGQAYPTRYQALQALRGLSWSQALD